jgi:hypothetical protein
MRETTLHLSSLSKTWIFDLDGTLAVHNGYTTGKDIPLPGVKKMIGAIPTEDFILILTARKESERKSTEEFLSKNQIRYNHILFEIPVGERVMINDTKPSGLKTAYALNLKRDQGLEALKIVIDGSL